LATEAQENWDFKFEISDFKKGKRASARKDESCHRVTEHTEKGEPNLELRRLKPLSFRRFYVVAEATTHKRSWTTQLCGAGE
jgi:hypothetical protein